MGMGNRTGRGFGYCGGEDRFGNATGEFGFRCGPGFGRGRGTRGGGSGRGFVAWLNRSWQSIGPQGMRYGTDSTPHSRLDPEREQHVLERQAEDLKKQLEAVSNRMDEINATPSSS